MSSNLPSLFRCTKQSHFSLKSWTWSEKTLRLLLRFLGILPPVKLIWSLLQPAAAAASLIASGPIFPFFSALEPLKRDAPHI